MRYISLPPDSHLPAEWSLLARQSSEAVAGLGSEKERGSYISSHGIWSALKDWLLGFGSTCWYCESDLLRAAWDVDHFRPKRKVTVRRKSHDTHKGYWWLTYDWRNYRISCQNCNRLVTDGEGESRGKGNEFPIRDESRRAKSADESIADEEPLLLDPCVEADTRLLIHTMDGAVLPAAEPGTWEYDRAEYTARQLYFDDPQIVERKLGHRQVIELLLKTSRREDLEPILLQRLSPTHEYATFLRAAVATHRDVDWIDDLF